MAPTKVLNCSHGQALSFEYIQYVQFAEGRALREFTPSGSLKKSSFFKKHFVLYLTIILFSRPVPRQPAHLYTQAESGAYLRDFSRVPRRRPFTYLKPPYAIGSVPSFSDHAIAYRWRSLPRVRRRGT